MIGSSQAPTAHAVRAPGEAAADRALLIGSLAAFRRRRRRVLGIRFLCTGLSVAVVIGEALALGVGAAHGAWLVAGAAATAVVASLLAAAVRTPSLSDTARLLDRQAPLQNRAATALQFAEDDGVMASLVVRDATQRIAALDPAVVFPREAPARSHLLVAAVTVSTLAFGAIVLRVSGTPQTGPTRSSGLATAGASNEAGQRAPGPSPGAAPAAAPLQGSLRTAIPEGTQARSTERAGIAPTPPDGRTAPPDARAAAPGTFSSGKPGGAVDGSQPRPDASTDTSTAGSQAAAGASGARSQAGVSRFGAGRGAAGEGADAPGASARGGGGVKGGALETEGVPAPALPRTTDRSLGSAVEYQAAWARAQAALAQDRVPPPLREYVRRYFEAIRSPRKP